MARASVRWASLLVSFIAAFVILVSVFSPSAIHSAQDAAQQWQDIFVDNASPGSINEQLGVYGPRAYRQVRSWWSRLFHDIEEPRGLQAEEGAAEDNPRCKVYTYYNKRLKSEDTEALLQVWLKAWWALGLFPFILTNEMSAKHSNYRQLHAQYDDSGLDMDKVDAILAMDHMGAEGMLMAPYVFPITTLDDKLLRQMRQCQVLDVLSKYSQSQDDILRGSSLAYKIVVKALITNTKPLNPGHVSSGFEAVPGVEIRLLDQLQIFAVYSRKTVKDLYPKLYDQAAVTDAEGKRFSFAKGQLASLVNSHLQDIFLRNYNNGIAVLNPAIQGISSGSLASSTMKIAKELLNCNLSPLPQSTCPPNRADKEMSCLSCSSLVSSAFIKPVEQFSIKNSTFFIGSVPHPLSTLIMTQGKEHPNAADIRDSPRDIWLKATLAGVLAPKSGAIQGLIYLSDSLWKNEDNLLPDAHLWHIYEQDTFSDVEYDVGFTLPGLNSPLSDSAFAAKNEAGKGLVSIPRLRSLVVDTQDDYSKTARGIIEAWSQYDAGSHQLIRNYQGYKADRLRVMKEANRGAFAVMELA